PAVENRRPSWRASGHFGQGTGLNLPGRDGRYLRQASFVWVGIATARWSFAETGEAGSDNGSCRRTSADVLEFLHAERDSRPAQGRSGIAGGQRIDANFFSFALP